MTRLDDIKARVELSSHDALYAPVYGDRRYLLELNEKLVEAARRAMQCLELHCDHPEAEAIVGELRNALAPVHA